MSAGRRIYEFLLAGSEAWARWDMAASQAILKNRSKLLLLFVLASPALFICLAEAASGRAMLGGHSAYAPAFYSLPIFLGSIAIGAAAGLITGCIGAGGGFIITPALMALGVKGILAVGTDLFHIFAKAIMGTSIHRKLGNVSVSLALAFLAGSIAGTFLGGALTKGIYDANPLISEMFISAIYALLLGFLGFYALADFMGSLKKRREKETPKAALPLRMQGFRLPPMIAFDGGIAPGRREISAWIVAAGGVCVGFLAAVMGVGGGFVTFPMFVYVFGVSSLTTVGTDIFQIIFTAGFAAIGQYAIYGYVFYTLAIGMLLGSLLGIQIGALATRAVNPVHIRGFYALSILAGFVNRASVLPGKLVELEYLSLPLWLTQGLETVGAVVFWLVVALFGCWVVGKFVCNLSALRRSNAG